MADKNTIMIVDDEKDIQDVLGIALTDMGYDVLTAGNGEDALELFAKERPSIILTDIKMPGMEGIDLLRKVKKENPDTEVIMITGHGDMDLAIESLQYDAIDFITKPISDDILELSLRRANEKIITRNQLRDYTERLEKLLQEKTQLQDHLSSLGFMIASISHGIKGLLTRLDGGLYLLDSAYKKENYQKIPDGLDILRQTVDRVKKMVLDILYYAKERDLTIKKIDVLGFANDVADVVSHKIENRNIEFIREFSDDGVVAEIDADSLHAALINILDNAIDACAEDTEKDFHKVIFSIKQDADNVAFDIHDNGKGMDGETKEKIFDLFFSSKGNKGTGFGLFIADNIVKQHRGVITVTSAMGKGSNFTIKIPKTRVDDN